MQASSWHQPLRLAVAAMAMAVSAQASAELMLYEHDNYGGSTLQVSGPTPNLKNENFNDMASSVVVRSGTWQLCGDANYRGQCITLSPGSYRSLSAMGLNDRISSIRPMGADGNNSAGGNEAWGGGWGGSNAAVELFEHADFGGQSMASQGSANLVRQGFNDRVSSVVIRSGRWEFCSDVDFRGRCVTLGPGSYANLSRMGINDQISSLRPSSGPPAYGSGRPQDGGWGGDDGSTPEVNLSGNRSGRVTFQNGCVAYYNASGQRFQNLPACHGGQVQRADEAMARYRSEQGLNRADTEHPWASSPGFSDDDPTPPEIIMGTNREGEVIFRNNCVAYYNAQGRRWQQQPSCSANQIRQSDQAMAAYRREQGM